MSSSAGAGSAAGPATDFTRSEGTGGSLSSRLQGIRRQANVMPSQRNTSDRSSPVRSTSNGASPLLSRKAPTPKPMTTTPVTSPLWSGNHLATVATGVT